MPASPRSLIFSQAMFRLSRNRLILLVVSILLIAVSWWQVLSATSGLVVRQFEREGIPMRYVGPENGRSLPGVLIAHGFSGSQQLMLGFAYRFAHAGYGVVLWDFAGHGGNADPLSFERGDALQANIATAYDVLQEQPEIDGRYTALLGHSMGSGIVMQEGADHADRYMATIAVSPTGADVSPGKPRNFLLMAGQLEPPFVQNAADLLAQAGGKNNDLANGNGRDLVIISRVEHLSILFSSRAHDEALAWLDRTFGGRMPSDYTDWRILWYGLHLVGWLSLATAVAPLLPISHTPQTNLRRRPYHWIALIVAPFVASGLLFLLNQFIGMGQILGILLGGSLGVWFLLMGLIWLGVGFRPPQPTMPDLGWGLAVFALLWVSFGLMGQFVWLPWLLNGARLWRWLLLAVTFIPWLTAVALMVDGLHWRQKIGWWLAHSLLAIMGLATAVLLIPSLFFIVIIIPLLPIILAFMMIAGVIFRRPYAFALGGALFFSWLLVATFPLTG